MLIYCIGIIRDDLLTIEEKSLNILPDFSSLTVTKTNYVSDELLDFDEKITGMRRQHYLRTLLTDSFELLECRSSTGALVGYSAVIDLIRCFYVLMVLVDVNKSDHQTGIGSDNINNRCENVPTSGLRLLLTHMRTAFNANNSSANPKPILVTPLRGVSFAPKLCSLLTRLGLHYMFSAAKFLIEPSEDEAVVNNEANNGHGVKQAMAGAALALWRWQKPPDSIVVGPYGNLVSF